MFWFSNNAILAGLVPALLIVLGGIWVLKKRSGRWFVGYLLAILAGLLVFLIMIQWTRIQLENMQEFERALLCSRFKPILSFEPILSSGRSCNSVLNTILDMISFALLPAALGTLAGLFYYTFRPHHGWRGWAWVGAQAGLFALGIGSMVVFSTVAASRFFAIRYLLLLYILLPGILLSTIWQMRQLPGGEAGVVLLALFATFEVVSSGGRGAYGAGLNLAYNLAFVIFLPIIFTGLAAILAGELVSRKRKPSYLRSAFYLVGIAFLIWMFSYVIWSESIWDRMEDSSTGQVLLLGGLIAGIGSSILLAWRLAGRKKAGALVLAVIFAASFTFAQQAGDHENAESLTFQRASQIDQAIEKFQARNGRYPETLSELTPWYLFTIPRPFMYRDLSWCYQGRKDFYRFGYIYRPIAYAPPEWIEIRIQGSAGTSPEGGWACEEDLQEKKAIAPSP